MTVAEARLVSIDGSRGEGGGQILRTSLALSLCLGLPFRINHIRAARKRPGLQPQHLASVKAAAVISQAQVEGDNKDSQSLLFIPARVSAGRYHFAVGTAGSTTLVLQTILPALMLADAPSSVVLEGGTHNPYAPPFDFLQTTFLPLINRLGPTVNATLERHGFAPQGGGRVRLDIQPATRLRALEIPQRGMLQAQHATVLLAHLPGHIAERELIVLKNELGYTDENLSMKNVVDADGPGNVVSAVIQSEQITECFSAFGQRRLSAERVAARVVQQVRRYLQAGVPVGHYLADQLLLPLALAGRGQFVTLQPSSHTLTNLQVISAFMPVKLQVAEMQHDVWKISL